MVLVDCRVYDGGRLVVVFSCVIDVVLLGFMIWWCLICVGFVAFVGWLLLL